MNMWMARKFKSLNAHRAMAAAVTALAVVLSMGSYVVLKPAAASASSAAPAAAPLDENSVSALLSLDRAMETLAAHVTPAVVNVTVASRGKHQQVSEDDQNGIERFFGPFFGQPSGPQQF